MTPRPFTRTPRPFMRLVRGSIVPHDLLDARVRRNRIRLDLDPKCEVRQGNRIRNRLITPSGAREAAEHEADHRAGDPGLTGGAEPLIIPTRAALGQKPGERSFNHPSSWDDVEPRLRQVLRPINLVLRKVVGDPVALPAMDRFGRLHPPAGNLLDPVLAFAMAVVAGIEPQQLQAGASAPDRPRIASVSTSLMPSRSMLLAGCTCTACTKPSVSTRLCRLRPTRCLPPS